MDDRLDGFMHMMMLVLASNGRLGAPCRLAIDTGGRVTILATLGGEALLYVVCIIVFERPVLDGSLAVVMLLCKRLGMGHWLLSGVIMVLVHLTVNGLCLTLVLGLSDSLMLDSWSDSLVDCGVMLPGSSSGIS